MIIYLFSGLCGVKHLLFGGVDMDYGFLQYGFAVSLNLLGVAFGLILWSWRIRDLTMYMCIYMYVTCGVYVCIYINAKMKYGNNKLLYDLCLFFSFNFYNLRNFVDKNFSCMQSVNTKSKLIFCDLYWSGNSLCFKRFLELN